MRARPCVPVRARFGMKWYDKVKQRELPKTKPVLDVYSGYLPSRLPDADWDQGHSKCLPYENSIEPVLKQRKSSRPRP